MRLMGDIRLIIMSQQIAEHIPLPKGSNDVPKWQLQNETWREVRPYEMEKLEDEDADVNLKKAAGTGKPRTCEFI